jgi:class 3 adenylate cyclase
VIGDTKPQFSLIGYTVNKAAKLCSACIGNNILVSKESQTKIANISNGFNFKKTQLVLTEFGVETAFSVTKNKMLGFRARNVSLAEM